MKIKFLTLAALFAITAHGPQLHAQTNSPVSTRLDDRTPKGIVKYFDRLIQDKLIIVGQHCGGGDKNQRKGYQEFFEALHTQTGKYPALLGLEYGWWPGNDFAAINQLALDHWKQGGLVTLTWHADNPFADGYNVRWDSVAHKDGIDFKKLLSTAPPSKEKDNYRGELLQVAAQLKKLKAAGVVVLWRPFHEMTGPWFWWGPNDPKQPTNLKDFQLLWLDMHRTFDELGLDNLVWVYAGFDLRNQIDQDIFKSMYPGAHVVDVVGMDIYQVPVPDLGRNLATMQSFQKPIVISECGGDAVSPLDEREFLEQYAGKAACFMQWTSWYNSKLKALTRRAIVDNAGAKEMMNAPAVITLDKIR
jgi:mannan endo-1,4-beta-mannosidase